MILGHAVMLFDEISNIDILDDSLHFLVDRTIFNFVNLYCAHINGY